MEKKKQQFLRMMREMLARLPEEWPSVEELVYDEWIREDDYREFLTDRWRRRLSQLNNLACQTIHEMAWQHPQRLNQPLRMLQRIDVDISTGMHSTVPFPGVLLVNKLAIRS